MEKKIGLSIIPNIIAEKCLDDNVFVFLTGDRGFKKITLVTPRVKTNLNFQLKTSLL